MSENNWNDINDITPIVIQTILNKCFPIQPSIDIDNGYTLLTKYNYHGMDWWTFPWDNDSSLGNIYTLDENLMKYLLSNIKVKLIKKFVFYSNIFKEYTTKLDYKIITAHGGILRVIKVIYCTRNFLYTSIILKIKDKNDINNNIINLMKCVEHIIKINDKGKYLDDIYKNTIPNEFYSKTYCNHPFTKIPEDRTVLNGIKELKLLYNFVKCYKI